MSLRPQEPKTQPVAPAEKPETQKTPKKPPLSPTNKCPSLGNEAILQAGKIRRLMDDEAAELLDLKGSHDLTLLRAKTEGERLAENTRYSIRLRDQRRSFHKKYVPYREEAIKVRDAVLLSLPYRQFDNATVPYDHPSGPDDLKLVAEDLERLGKACIEQRPN